MAAQRAERFEAIGGDVKFAQTQGCCLNMLATNTAPVSLSSSLFSVTMYNQASSPRLLTMSFHIMLLHTRSCSRQAVTQLLCLKVGAPFCRRCTGCQRGADGACGLSALPSQHHWQQSRTIARHLAASVNSKPPSPERLSF